MAFLSGAGGNPANSKARIAAQTALGLPPAEAAWRDMNFNGPFGVVTPGSVRPAVISAGGAPQPRIPGKVVVANPTLSIGDFDPSNPALYHVLAQLFEQYDLSTIATTGSRWDFNRAGASSGPPALGLLVDDDVNPRLRYFDCEVQSFAIISADDNLVMQAVLGQPWVDGWGVPVQTIGTGSDIPSFRSGISGVTWDADADDEDYFLRIDVDNGSSWDVSAKVGTGGAYSTQFTITEGVWAIGVDENGNRWPRAESPIEIFVPVGATMTVLDEFQVPKRRAAWAQSLATERFFPRVSAFVLIDGALFEIQGSWTFQVGWEQMETRGDRSRRSGGRVNRSGMFVGTFEFQRQAADVDMQRRLVEADNVSVLIDGEINVDIPTTSPLTRYRMLAGMPQASVTGDLFNAGEGATNRDETVVLESAIPTASVVHRGITLDQFVHVVIDSDVSAL